MARSVDHHRSAYEMDIPESFGHDWGFAPEAQGDLPVFLPDAERVRLPEEIRDLVTRLRRTEAKERTPALPLYDEFQEIINRNHATTMTTGVKPLYSIKTAYETHAYVHQKSVLKQSIGGKIGTLALIFLSYAKGSHWDQAAPCLLDDVQRHSMRWTDFLHMCKDWKISPTLLSRRDGSICCQKASKGREQTLSYIEFVEALGRAAVVAFSRPRMKMTYQLPLEKVRALTALLKLDNEAFVRNKLIKMHDLHLFRERQEVSHMKEVTRKNALRSSQVTSEPLHASIVAELHRYDLCPIPESWSSFLGPWLDLGTVAIGRNDTAGFVHKYKLIITNTSKQLLNLEIDAYHLAWIDFKYTNVPLAPGMSRALQLRLLPTHQLQAGEFLGSFRVTLRAIGSFNSQFRDAAPANSQYILDIKDIPVYANFVGTSRGLTCNTRPGSYPLEYQDVDVSGVPAPPPLCPPLSLSTLKSRPHTAPARPGNPLSLVAPPTPMPHHTHTHTHAPHKFYQRSSPLTAPSKMPRPQTSHFGGAQPRRAARPHTSGVVTRAGLGRRIR